MFFLDLLNALPGAVSQGMIWGIMAIGVFITFRILDIADLTVDGTIIIGMAVCARLIVAGCPVIVAILVAFIAGLLAGLITGILHTKMGIPAILAGILTQLMMWSVTLKVLGGASVAISARNYPLVVALLNPAWKNLLILCGFVVLVIGALYWFFGTELGCAIRATGSNLHMSRAQGINTDFTKVLGLMLSNGIVALAGALLAQFQGFADVTSGRGAIVIGLAAIVISEALFSRIARNFAVKLLAVVGGGIAYFLIYQVVILLGLDPDLLKMLSAVIVAIFLAVPYWKSKVRFKKKEKVPAEATADAATDTTEEDAQDA